MRRAGRAARSGLASWCADSLTVGSFLCVCGRAKSFLAALNPAASLARGERSVAYLTIDNEIAATARGAERELAASSGST